MVYDGNTFDALNEEQFGLAWSGEALPVAVPEPDPLALLLARGLGLAGLRRGRSA